MSTNPEPKPGNYLCIYDIVCLHPALGHSLGGAHATLCTLDIIHELRGSLPPHHISCYTYGAPRVGNHAFAAMYDKVSGIT